MHRHLSADTSFEQDDSDDEHVPIVKEFTINEEQNRNIGAALERLNTMLAVKQALPTVPSGEESASSDKPTKDYDDADKDELPTYLLVASSTMGWRKRLLSDVRVGRKADYKIAGNAPTTAADTDTPPTTLDQRDVGRPRRPTIVSRVNQTVNREKVFVRYNTANVGSI